MLPEFFINKMRVVSLVFLLWFPCFGVAIIDENSAAVVDELKKVIAAKAKIGEMV